MRNAPPISTNSPREIITSFYIVFEFILQKIKKRLKNYFTEINPDFNINNIKNIHFLDFPGEVEEQTLGGLLTNLANECINLYAGSSYSSLIEKILREKINLRLFRPLHSYYMVKTLMGKNGLFHYLSNPFTENNYNSLIVYLTFSEPYTFFKSRF